MRSRWLVALGLCAAVGVLLLSGILPGLRGRGGPRAGSAGDGGGDGLTPLTDGGPTAAPTGTGGREEPPPLAPLAESDEAAARLQALGGDRRSGPGATGAAGTTGPATAGTGREPGRSPGAAGGSSAAGATEDPRYTSSRPTPTTDVITIGTVTGRVVRRSDGLAIAGAEVRAFTPKQGPDQAKQITTTDDDGRFTLAVPAGDTVLEARAGAHAPEMVAGIDVVADQTTDVGDVVLASGALVHGTVTGADNQPRAGVTVRAFAVHQGAQEVTTDAAGRYRLAGLAPANYFVEVKNAPAGDVFPTYVVTLELGADKVLDFGITPGVALEVTVLRDGSAVADAEVRFISRAGTIGDVGLKMDDVRTSTVRTDVGGRARFTDLVPGPYDLVVSHRDKDTEGKPTGPNRVMTQRVNLAPGDGTVSVTVTYPAASLRGQVLAADTDAPIGGVRIAIEPAELRGSRNLADTLVALGRVYVSTDGEGRFTMPHIAPGEYSVSALKEGYVAVVLTDVRVGAGGIDGLRVVMTPGGGTVSLTATVGGERAVQGCFAMLRGPFGADAGLQAISVEGNAKFTGLRAGIHTLLVFAPNQPVIVREGVVVVAGETTDVSVDIPAPPESGK